MAEGANGNTSDRDRRPGRQMCIVDDPFGRGSLASSASDSSQVLKLTKQQIKTLQEAMYHSAESGHLGEWGSLGCRGCLHFPFLEILKMDNEEDNGDSNVCHGGNTNDDIINDKDSINDNDNI